VARNAGNAIVKGEIIACMDPDDIALPQRLTSQWVWMQANDVEVCGTWAEVFGAEQGEFWFPETHEGVKHELLFRIGMLHPTVMMRAYTVRETPYLEGIDHEDYELWTRLVLKYRTGNVPQVLLKFRRHSRQGSVVRRKGMAEDFRVYQQRYFTQLFPNRSEEYIPLAFLYSRRPFTNMSCLQKAGEWLVELAHTEIQDILLIRAMQNRWLAACRRSAQLGLGTYSLYRDYAPQFGVEIKGKQWALLLPCLLRQNTNSKTYQNMIRIKRLLRL